MNSNVINVRKNFPSSYQSLNMNEKNILPALIAKVKVQREYFRVLLLSRLKRADNCSLTGIYLIFRPLYDWD
jgi:hypothetical protein